MSFQSILLRIRNRRAARRNPRPSSDKRRPFLALEALEERTLLSTFYVVPSGTALDSTHFASLQGALGVAVTGDTIQVDQGASLNSVGSTLSQGNGIAALSAAANPSDLSISVNAPVPPGEEVQIGTGATPETDLVLASAQNGSDFELTLKAPLSSAHASGERVDTIGRLGIGLAVDIIGQHGPGIAAVYSPLDIWGVTLGVTLSNLTFGGNAPLTLLNGSQSTTITDSTITQLTEQGNGTNNGHNDVEENIVTGPVSITGNNSGTPTADVFYANHIAGTVQIAHDDGAVFQANIVTVGSGGGPAVAISDSQNLLFSQNTVTLTGATGTGYSAAALELFNQPGTTNSLNVTVLNNTFSTQGTGLGVLIAPSAGNGANFQVVLQGNDFQDNTIGLDDLGDGTTNATAAGSIDAGGGTLGGLGGNDFRKFLQTGANAGSSFAIFLNGTGASGTISALNNIWNTSDPTQVIRDGENNTSTGTLPAGTGTVDVGTPEQQLTADQQAVQALYNHILGRTGSTTEVDGWAAALPQLGLTGISNSILHSNESYTALVTADYVRFLGRRPDSGGLNYWTGQFNNGSTQEEVMAGFLGSAEYLSRVQGTGTSAASPFVQSLYVNLLGRQGSQSEISGWVSQLPTLGGAGVALDFLQSAEFRTIYVTGLYFTLLRRLAPPVAPEVAAWVNSTDDLLRIEADFAGSEEFYFNG
jgi:hypothetical protein